MKLNLSTAVLVLSVLVNVQTAIGNGDLSLAHMFPQTWIDAIVAWHHALAYIGTAIITALVAPGALGKGAPRSAVASAIALFFAFALLFAPAPARAADLAAAVIPAKAIPFSPTTCSTTQCSGLYAGLGISGNGASDAITSSGFASTAFSNGALLDLHGGWQMWNGSYLLGVEAGVGNNFQSGPIQLNGGSIVAYEGIKVGGALYGLFGQSSSSATTVSGQAASSLPVLSSLSASLIAPYAWIGMMQRNGYNQGTYGLGMEYVLAQNWNLDMRYEYGPAIGSLSEIQLVRLGLNYHFGLK